MGFSNVYAQTFVEPCGQVDVIEQLDKQYPGFKQQYNQQYLSAISSSKTVGKRKKNIRDTMFYYDTVYTVPVVFHVLYNNSTENINDSLILNQMEVLNRDFRRRNSDTVLTRTFFKDRAADVRIQFVFADKDPNGNATNGIIRKQTGLTSFGRTNGSINNNMKSSSRGGDDPWDPKKYVNVWVCDLSSNGQDALLGFAYPPFGHPSWTQNSWVGDANQGIVLHYKVVGRNNPLAVGGALGLSNMGRVAVHEFGHYFGLRHIWADDQYSANRCLVDDYIDDTPKQGTGSNFTCYATRNTCIDLVDDLPDMVENYMDYSTHECQNMFTRQQADMMLTALTMYRPGVITKKEVEVRARIFDTVLYDQILILPQNPQRELIVEVTDEDLLNNVSVEVYNAVGQLIVPNTSLNKNETIFPSMHFASGIYVVVIKKSDGSFARKKKIFFD